MYKVLIPTDRSDNANHALKYALNLLKGREVEFMLFHSFDMPSYSEDMPMSYPIDITDDLKSLLNEEVELLRKEHADSKFTFTSDVLLGSLSFNVEQLVDDLGIDLIVMGTKGATGLTAAIIGSNTVDVMQADVCPVLAVPQDAAITAPKRILFASDNKAMNTAKVLGPLLNIAERFGSHVHLMNVLDEDQMTSVDEAVEGLKLDHLLRGVEHTFHFENGKDKAQTIENYLNSHQIDLLAVVPRRLNFFEAIFHKSVTRQLALHTKIPLLAMHDFV